MAENDIYYKDGSSRILELLKDNLPQDLIHHFFDGDADPGESFYPCIIVTSMRAQIAASATQTDDIDETILIIVAFNKKDDVGADPNKDLTEYKLRKLVMGQDQNRNYLPQTIMYTLRKHYTLNDGAVIGNKIGVDFAPNQRVDQTINTQEAYITVSLKRQAIVPSRD